ncbi:DUF4034 domain-containing protein [Pleionea sp. CnH1-48]|uniref:DUF4034 domain-containing protein n=1 Tax=Pleionea sp. CnH1-48 TaxID=2954494 RepID=UPI002097B96E|nr:DUF4034 domain-containing protein [Pleionea sp. CnH1-48]MCO7226966.1 DUF4034 domain-containing protein [Pleionea sp. CnH1-48]
MSKADSFDKRYFISLGISREFPMEHLQAWVESESESADALLCYGARLLQRSWDIRGYGRGHEVGKDKWQSFYDSLDETSDVLLRYAEESPEDPTPWAYLIMASTWNAHDMNTRKYYFCKAIERDENNWAAHMHMIIALSQKWSGSNEEMIRFAERVADEAEDGSDLPIILIKAYLENWKYLDVFQGELEEAEAFIQSEEIRSRALAAYHKSLGSDKHRELSTTIFARYNASSWFWVVKDAPVLKVEFDKLGDNIEDIHWRWAGSEGELYQAREFAKKAG